MSPRRTLATAARVLAQLRADPRTVALLLVVPCLLMGLLALVALAEAGAGRLEAKSVAVLGVLAAVGGAMRLLSAGVAGLEPTFVVIVLAGRALGPRLGFLCGALALVVGSFLTGAIGPWTAGAYATWLRALGEEEAAHRWCAARIAFDQSLVSGPGDPDRAFVGGWNNRSRSFLPGTPWWRTAGAA